MEVWVRWFSDFSIFLGDFLGSFTAKFSEGRRESKQPPFFGGPGVTRAWWSTMQP